MKEFIKETSKKITCHCGHRDSIEIYQEHLNDKYLITGECKKCKELLINHYQNNVFEIKLDSFIQYYDSEEEKIIIDKVKRINKTEIATTKYKVLNKKDIEIYIPIPNDWCLFSMDIDGTIEHYILMKYGEQDTIKWDYIIPFVGILPPELEEKPVFKSILNII